MSDLTSARTGVIHDIGYQRYQGPRLGRDYALRSLYTYSLRSAFGLGRSFKSKIVPMTLGAFFIGPALLFTVLRSQGLETVTYIEFPAALTIPSVIFLALVAPELVSRDLRDRTLPLYFSRPLSRTCYALAKAAALFSALMLLLSLALLIMYLGAVFSVEGGLTGVLDETGDFLQGLLNAAILTAVPTSLSILIASLSGRRVLASGMVVALFMITAPVSTLLQEAAGSEDLQRLAGLLDPLTLTSGVTAWLFDVENYATYLTETSPYGLLYTLAAFILTVGSLLLLVLRYRKVAS